MNGCIIRLLTRLFPTYYYVVSSASASNEYFFVVNEWRLVKKNFFRIF